MNIKGLNELLKTNGFDPDEVIEVDGNKTTVFTYVEAHLMGAFDEVEEAIDSMAEEDTE